MIKNKEIYLPPKCAPLGVQSHHFVWNEPHSLGLRICIVITVVSPGFKAGTNFCCPSGTEVNLI